MYQPKIILVVMDGWGYSSLREGNAIAQANKPNFDNLWFNYPHALLEAAGEPIGLPWGSIGSSEVGHLCLGSGRIIDQDLPRVSKAIATGAFFRNLAIWQALEHAKKYKSRLHLVGLASAGGVHSHIDHLFALLDFLKHYNFHQPSYIHMLTDGRDTPPKTALNYVAKINQKIASLDLNTQIATVIGRYYGMDRDSHWERTYAAYNALVLGKGRKAYSASEAITQSYLRDKTDEFIEPTVILKPQKKVGFLDEFFQGKTATPQVEKPVATIGDNDAVIFFNFRPERMRQLVETFFLAQRNFPAKKILKNLFAVSMTEYEKLLPIRIALPPEKVTNPLAKILADRGMCQIHLAETEKYAHVTYFFDGGQPTPFKNEQWVVVPSPRVTTYDLKPEMSAVKITERLFDFADGKKYDFVLINYANVDLVGHTGNLAAAIKAVETIDRELGRLVQAFPEAIMLITADHGNAEQMMGANGELDTEHSVNPVPFILFGPEFYKKIVGSTDKPIGILADIAPTILDYLGIQVPSEMTGYSLIEALI